MRKTVLITGTSSGLGKAAAIHFAANGWNVVATMRMPAAERDLVEIDGVLVTRLDVQDPASIRQAIDAGIERFGTIDTLINNAGFGLFGIFEAISREKIQEQFDVNLFGVMEVTRAILQHFRKKKIGTIINISSGAGVFALPAASLYCASKFALEGYSEALSYELASQGVVVKIVEPGGVISTKFGQRSSDEARRMNVPAGYEPFAEKVTAIFEGLRLSRRATEGDVAKVIFRAATDGTNQLRYIGTDDIRPLLISRRETSEDEYMRLMRSQFLPGT